MNRACACLVSIVGAVTVLGSCVGLYAGNFPFFIEVRR